MNINPKDLRVEVFGGSVVGTTESSCRLTHIPTSTRVEMSGEGSYRLNQQKALKKLIEILTKNRQ